MKIMKNYLLLIMSVLFALPGLAQSFYYEYEGQNIRYEVLDEENKTCATYGGYYGVNIYDIPFWSPGNKVSESGKVILPSHPEKDGVKYTLTTIGKCSFIKGSNVSEIVIPETVTTIEKEAFYSNENLRWIIIPESVEKIEESAFESCSNLHDVMNLSKNCEIETHAFYDCKKLYRVASYENDYFNNRNGLWTILDDETVDAEKGIIWAAPSSSNPYPWVSGKYSGKLEIPRGVTTLTWICMAFCENITEVVLPESLTVIGTQSFYGCEGLKQILIPEAVTTIYSEAFRGCTGLQEVLLPTKVTEVGEGLFWNTNLKKGGYPDAISNPFGENVVSVAYDAYNSKIENGCVYSRRNDMLYYVPMTVGPDFVVPDGVTEITDDAFAFCEDLTTLTLPNTVTTLGKRVWNGCNALKSVTCYVTEPISAERDLFPVDAYDSATLYVPGGSVAAYEKTTPWSYFYDIKSVEESGVETVPAIEDVAIDFTLPYEVFNLNGVKIAESTDNLPAGIYIIRQGNAVKKIVVK
ncbi:MAG: leucine-rich repeat protein [Bacteroides sp.]|nr:leucine-rich repeat protein [Bacteroides sp.]